MSARIAPNSIKELGLLNTFLSLFFYWPAGVIYSGAMRAAVWLESEGGRAAVRGGGIDCCPEKTLIILAGSVIPPRRTTLRRDQSIS